MTPQILEERLIDFAVLMETSEEWETGRAYLNLTTQD